MKKLYLVAVLALAGRFSSPVLAADNYQVKDANGTTITIKSKDNGGGIEIPQSIPTDQTGTPYGQSNPQYFGLVGTAPLPTGAATSALQTTGNTSLSSIDSKTPALVGGAVPVTGSFSAITTGTYNASPPTLSNGANSALQLDASGNLRVTGSFSASTAGAVTTAAPSYSNGTNQSLSLTTAGALRTDGSATTQPVSGTVGVSGTVPVSGTFFQATQPVSLAALPALPTGSNAIGSVSVSSGSVTANQGAGSGNFATAQATIATSATQVVAARSGRNSVTIENTGTTPIYLGGSGVTTGTGMLLPGVLGASITIPTSAAVYGIVASGTQPVSALETY